MILSLPQQFNYENLIIKKKGRRRCIRTLQDLGLKSYLVEICSQNNYNPNKQIIIEGIHYILHRTNGPAVICTKLEFYEYYKMGMRHRINGPAYIDLRNGRREWVRNDLYHRTDGPAIFSDLCPKEYYLNGIKYYSEEEYFENLTTKQRISYIFNMSGNFKCQ